MNRTNTCPELLASVKSGACSFTYGDETGAFHTLTLSCADGVLLTPGYVDTTALYQVIRCAVIDEQAESVALDIETVMSERGATFSRLRPLYRDGTLTALWVAAGSLSLFISPEQCRAFYHDMRECFAHADLSPDDYMNIITAATHTR